MKIPFILSLIPSVFYKATKVLINACFRYSTYRQMVYEGIINPEKLPPTTDHRAAYFHGLRVHLQNNEWMCLGCYKMGMKLRKWFSASPTNNDKDVAPPNLLKVLCCKCKFSSEN